MNRNTEGQANGGRTNGGRSMAIRAIVALLSAGWLVPMWLGVSALLDFVEVELWPLLLQQPKLNSFPFIEFAERCFAVGFLWLGIAIAAWAWVGMSMRQRAAQTR
ncbi:MAG: hypothetical protein IT473_06465 [Lysobacter sp.]|nr:hypothetical protein [Lysobacter sp.]